MSDFDNTNKGVLFPEKDKKSEKSPDYTGKVNSKCSQCGHSEDKRLAGWKRQSKNGGVFLSIAVSELTETQPKSLGDQWRKRDEVAEVPDDEFNLGSIPF